MLLACNTDQQRVLAEKEGFEPSRPFQDNSISSRARYDRFDTSPRMRCARSPCRPFIVADSGAKCQSVGDCRKFLKKS